MSARVVALGSGAYVTLLVTVVAWGVLGFGFLNAMTPLQSAESNEGYRLFLGLAGPVLAVGLGTWAAVCGVWRGSLAVGIGALGLGLAGTLAALSLLPTVHFPHDRYPAPAAWLMGNALACGTAWLLTTVLGRLGLGPAR